MLLSNQLVDKLAGSSVGGAVGGLVGYVGCCGIVDISCAIIIVFIDCPAKSSSVLYICTACAISGLAVSAVDIFRSVIVWASI